MSENTEKKTLKDVMPREFCGVEYLNTRAYAMKDREVIKEYLNFGEGEWKPWPGTAKNVHFWVVLASGHAVGWNENPARGWSFPVISYKE